MSGRLKHVVLGALALLGSSAAMAQSLSNPREGWTNVDGGRIHFTIRENKQSTKSPLLLLHGAYMSGAGMKAFTDRFATSRTVIIVDQRGHGQTGDLAGAITYEKLADDAAAVIKQAGMSRADVVGYSMGAGAALQLAIRHPELVGKLVSISGSFNSQGVYPEMLKGVAAIEPKMFDGTPIKREYERLSPTPKAFPSLVEKLKALDQAPQDWAADDIRKIAARTMIIVGDHDVVRPEHAVEMFRLRGGAPASLVVTPFLDKAPPARLAVLPATSHLGIMAQPDLIVALVTPFLDDVTPAVPPGFF